MKQGKITPAQYTRSAAVSANSIAPAYSAPQQGYAPQAPSRPQIRLAQPQVAQTISIRQSKPAPAQTISTKQIQPAQSVQRTAMPQPAQFRVPTVNPQMPQTQQIQLPKMNQPKPKQPNLLQKIGDFTGAVNNATYGTGVNMAKGIGGAVQRAVGTVSQAGVGVYGAGDALSSQLQGKTDEANRKSREYTGLIREMGTGQAIDGGRTSFISQNTLDGKSSPVDFGKEFVDAGVQTASVLPMGRVLNGAQLASGLTKPVVKDILKVNAKQALVYGTGDTANDVLQGRGITPQSLAVNYGAPMALGSASEFGGVALNKGAKVVGDKATANATKAGEQISGLPKANVLNDNEAFTLSDFGDYVGKRHLTDTTNPAVIQQINELQKQAYHAAKNAGVDIQSGSARDIQGRIADYLERRDAFKQGYSQVAEGGSVPAGMFDPTGGRLGKQPDVPKQDLIIKNGEGKAMSIDDPTAALKQEALKYKSADEFVKAQGEPVYHGTGSKFDKFDSQFQGQNYRQGEGGFHFTSKKSTAENYATLGAQSQGKASGHVIEAHLKLNKPLTVEAPSSIRAADFYDDHIGDIQLQAMQNGNDGIIVKGNGENLHIALSPDVIHTKQQLTDLYNQAHSGKAMSIEPKQSNWRESVDNLKFGKDVDVNANILSEKQQTLRAITQVSKSDQELSDVIARAEQLHRDGYLGDNANLAWDVMQNPSASKATKAKAKALYDDITKPAPKPTLQDALEGKSTKIKASADASTIDQTVSPVPTAPKKQPTRKQSNQVLPAQENSQTVTETSTVNHVPDTQAQTGRTYTTDSTPLTDTKQYVEDMTRAQNDARKGDINLREKGADFKAKFIDDLSPIEDRLNKAIKEGAQVDPKDHIRYQLDRSRRAEGITQAYINDKGLARIIQDVPNTNEFDQYLIAKHAKELDEGVKTGRNAQADQQLIDELAPEYEAYAQEIYKYNQGLLDQAVDYGLISKELAQSLKKQYPEYVPLNRVFKDDELSGVFGSKADASISKQSAVQKIKGSNRAISSPLNSIIDKTRVVVEQGERNKAAQMLASYEKLDGNPFNLKEIPTSETIGNRSTISFLDNGKKRTFETDPDIAEASKHMTREQIGLWGRIAAVPARVLRAGATGVNAGFAGANVVKDIIGSAINSQHGMRVADPRNLAKGLAAALNHNGKYYQELMREGVAGTSFDMYRNPNKMNVGEIRSQKNLGTRSAYNITHPGQWYRTLENSIGRSEDFGRALQYYSNKDGYRAKGMNEADVKLLAGDQARYNATNFFRSGSYGKGINLAVPYWNAGVQGARIQVRRIKERPVQTVAKMGLAIAAPSAMIAVNNYGDEDKRAVINQIADYEKKGNIIVVGDNAKFNEQTNRWEDVYKIPVPPQHIGIHNAIQKAVESSYNGTPYDIVAALGGIAENYTTVNPTELRANANRLTPQGLKLIAEPLTNTNMYTGNAIVPFYQKDLPANEQVSKYSSLTAKTIGNLTNTSPRMIDNAIRTGAGGAGQNAVNIIDNGLAAAGVGKKDEVRGKSITSSISDRFVGANQKQDDKKSAKVVADEKAAKKKADTGWMDEYNAAKSKFEKESKNWNEVERTKKAKELASLEVKKNFSKEATSLYDMAERDIYGFLDKQDDKKAQHYLNQIVDYGDKMVAAGLWSTNKLKDRYGNVQYDRNYNSKSAGGSKSTGTRRTSSTGTRRSSGTRTARGGSRSAKGKFDYKLFGFAKAPSQTSSDLYGLLKKAKMKRNTA